MDIDIQRKIDRVAGTFTCRILSLFSGKKNYFGHTPKKILVILLSEMGSLVLAIPMFDRLKTQYPNAEIFCLLFEQNKTMLELIGAVPSGNILTASNESLPKLIISSIQVIRKIRKINIDTIIDCELFSRISSIYSFFSGAKIRVGFHRYKQEGLYRGDFINRPVLYNPYNHISQQFVVMAEAIESKGIPGVKRSINQDGFSLRPTNFTPDEIEYQKAVFHSEFSNIMDKKLILLYPGGGLLPIRAWPLENYCLLAEKLIKKGHAVAIIGLQSDRNIAKKIQSHCHSEYCIDLTGYTDTVRELMIIFHFASLLITNDGGPGHFAALTPVPTIIFYGPETPALYGPLSRNSYAFYQSFSCSPCLTAYNHRNSPCDGNNLCLQDIKLEDVLRKADEMLNN